MLPTRGCLRTSLASLASGISMSNSPPALRFRPRSRYTLRRSSLPRTVSGSERRPPGGATPRTQRRAGRSSSQREVSTRSRQVMAQSDGFPGERSSPRRHRRHRAFNQDHERGGLHRVRRRAAQGHQLILGLAAGHRGPPGLSKGPGVPDAIRRIQRTPGLMETFATSKARDRWFGDRVLGERRKSKARFCVPSSAPRPTLGASAPRPTARPER